MRTIPDICKYLQKLDHYVEKVCILAFTDGHIPSNIERELLSLPVKLRGTGIVILANIAKTERQNSRNITKSLTKLHLEQYTAFNINREELTELKNNIKKEKLQDNKKNLQSLRTCLLTTKFV